MSKKFPVLPIVTLILALSLAGAAGAQDQATTEDKQSAEAADQAPALPAAVEPAVTEVQAAPTAVEPAVAETQAVPAAAQPAATEVQAEPAAAEPANAAIADAAPLSQSVRDAVGAPAEGKALIVFFRPSKFVGAAVGFKVRENEVELGKLRNGNYFTVQVEPGAHAYVVHSEAKDVTNLEVEAGETYFLSAAVTMGFMAGRPNLTPSDAAAFEAALPKLKKSKPLE